MQKFKTFLTVIGAVAILVLAANSALYAATGGEFILGKKNSANNISTLKRTTPGPALKLKTTSSAAPMVVTGAGKVANLNADKVDGLNAADLQTRSRIYHVPPASGVSSFATTFTGLAPGIYLVSYSLQTSMSTGNLHCWFYTGSGGAYTMWNSTATHEDLGFAAASGVVDTRTQSLSFNCNGGTMTVSTADSASSQIVFTRIDGLASGSASSARVSSGRVAPNAR
jgi:hypothetical protein